MRSCDQGSLRPSQLLLHPRHGGSPCTPLRAVSAGQPAQRVSLSGEGWVSEAPFVPSQKHESLRILSWDRLRCCCGIRDHHQRGLSAGKSPRVLALP